MYGTLQPNSDSTANSDGWKLEIYDDDGSRREDEGNVYYYSSIARTAAPDEIIRNLGKYTARPEDFHRERAGWRIDSITTRSIG